MRQISLLILIGLLVSAPLPALAFTNSPMQGAHQDILSTMETEEPRLLPQFQVLWQSALNRNPTIQLAMQKMAEKTGQVKPKDKASWTSKMLQSMVHLGGMGAAIVTQSPLPLLGSSVVNRVSAPEYLPQRMTAVSSADLVILAKEIEQAQTDLILAYFQYRYALEARDALQGSLDKLQHQIQTLPEGQPEAVNTLQTLIAKQAHALQKAQDQVGTCRNLLVLSSGEPAVAQVDQLIQHPEKTEKTESPADEKPQG